MWELYTRQYCIGREYSFVLLNVFWVESAVLLNGMQSWFCSVYVAEYDLCGVYSFVELNMILVKSIVFLNYLHH